MKNLKEVTDHLFVCGFLQIEPDKQVFSNPCFTAIFACLLSGSLRQAQVIVKVDFEDAPGTTTSSDASLGGVVVALVCRLIPVPSTMPTGRPVQEYWRDQQHAGVELANRSVDGVSRGL